MSESVIVNLQKPRIVMHYWQLPQAIMKGCLPCILSTFRKHCFLLFWQTKQKIHKLLWNCDYASISILWRFDWKFVSFYIEVCPLKSFSLVDSCSCLIDQQWESKALFASTVNPKLLLFISWNENFFVFLSISWFLPLVVEQVFRLK